MLINFYPKEILKGSIEACKLFYLLCSGRQLRFFKQTQRQTLAVRQQSMKLVLMMIVLLANKPLMVVQPYCFVSFCLLM